MSDPALLVVIVAANDLTAIAAVKATEPDPDFWGDPTLSANGWGKWGVWEVQLSPGTKAALGRIPRVQLFDNDAAANTAVGWVDVE